MKKTLSIFTGALAMMTISGCAANKPSTVFNYPQTKKVAVVDDYHGTPVADPYRWLEDAASADTKSWVEAQNNLSRSYLDKLPGREKIKTDLTAMWQYETFSVPYKRGDRLFFFKNDGIKNQPELMVQDGNSDAYTLIDVNQLSQDGTVEIASIFPSDDGKLLAYATSGAGSDWQIIYLYDVDKKELRQDKLDWCKFSDVSWLSDNSGFFYNRYEDPANVSKEHMTGGNKVWFHKVGTEQSSDKLVYEEENDLNMIYSPEISADGKYLIITIVNGTDPENKVFIRPVDSNSDFEPLFDKPDAMYLYVTNIEDKFYFHSNLKAPKGRLIAKKIGSNEIEEVIPEQQAVLDGIRQSGDRFVAAYMNDATHNIKVYGLDGQLINKVEMPTLGSISGFRASEKNSLVYFGFESFINPKTIYSFDSTKLDKPTAVWPISLPVDTSRFETKQYFITSKDGTKVPIFVTAKKNLERNGNNPTILYGYGGFNINMTPFFKIHRLWWLEQGGVYVVANLRGGTEYGEEWHRAGMLENKQNVFDDFISAAKYLISEKFTSPAKLSINGGSNGGLLVSTCLLQAPELFGAAVSQVPVTDMLRYHRFTVGRFWTGEYGNAEENADHFKFMYAYSPLHNVPAGIKAPPTLVTTADTDDRVVPAHSYKYVATLQAAQTGTNPVLLRVDTKAGHGHGKPIYKQIDELVDIYSFTMFNLGMNK